jgi:hypothetical protein
MSDRYRLPDPKCRHTWTQRVEAGEIEGGGPYASTYVCDREACVQDAKAWAHASTHAKPRVVLLRRSR